MLHHLHIAKQHKEKCFNFNINIKHWRAGWFFLGWWIHPFLLQSHDSIFWSAVQPTCSPQTLAVFFFLAAVDWLAISADTLLEWERSPQNYQVNRLGSQGQQNLLCLHTIHWESKAGSRVSVVRQDRHHFLVLQGCLKTTPVCVLFPLTFFKDWNSHNHVVCFWSLGLSKLCLSQKSTKKWPTVKTFSLVQKKA